MSTNWFDDPPPPLRRHKFEFAPRMPDDPPIQTDIIREAIRNMSDDEIVDMAIAVLAAGGLFRPPGFEITSLAAKLKVWARGVND